METILKPYKHKIKEMEKMDQEKVFYGAQSPVRTMHRRQIEYEAGEEKITLTYSVVRKNFQNFFTFKFTFLNISKFNFNY